MKIEQNVGDQDKKLRLSAALVTAILALVLSGSLEAVFWVLTVVLVVTSIVGFCPAYTLLGKNTCGMGKSGKGECCGGGCHGEDKAEEKSEDDKAA
ncbi:MAG: DUF2892 domain-containing protein [Rhodospirillales bacterium]|nr:DUF2892 domain-containing protein [Rhodospirillales bacterium]